MEVPAPLCGWRRSPQYVLYNLTERDQMVVGRTGLDLSSGKFMDSIRDSLFNPTPIRRTSPAVLNSFLEEKLSVTPAASGAVVLTLLRKEPRIVDYPPTPETLQNSRR